MLFVTHRQAPEYLAHSQNTELKATKGSVSEHRVTNDAMPEVQRVPKAANNCQWLEVRTSDLSLSTIVSGSSRTEDLPPDTGT